MRKLRVFNNVSLDGYFTDRRGDMSFAHQRQDAEWSSFAAENARGESVFVFGRVTYDLMASHWPTPQAANDNPAVAKAMNERTKLVFSRTLDEARWQNTKLLKGDPATEIRKLKAENGPDMLIMGSGTIISQLTRAALIDEYQIVLLPIVLGAGRTMFEGLEQQRNLQMKRSRTFSNGNIVLWYEPHT